MNTIESLRAALDDTDTPAGVEVSAIRRLARRQRLRAVGTVATAVAVVAAIAVPVAVVRQSRGQVDRPPTSGTADGPACPSSLPTKVTNTGAGLADQLVPFTPDQVLACAYETSPNVQSNPGLDETTYLTSSRALPADVARRLLDRYERGSPQSVGPCTDELKMPVLFAVTGAGRSLILQIDPFGCMRVTNGTRTLYAGMAAKAELDAALAAVHPRLACPEQEPQERPGKPGPADRLVPFRPDYLIFCDWSVPRPVGQGAGAGAQEADGPDARRYIQELERLPARKGQCTIDPGPDNIYLVIIVGAGQRTTLFGGRKCFSLTNGRRTVYASSTDGVPQIGK